ncbi:MAG: hypothetical protein KC503_17765 [Myxococcales bacterium]|nr:hypothetical protein [Myxococcales bacterium]
MHHDNYPATAMLELRRRCQGKRGEALRTDVGVDPGGRTAAVSLEDRRHVYQVLLSTRDRHDGSLHVDLRVDRHARNASRHRQAVKLCASGRIARGRRVVLARVAGDGGFELALTVA